MSIAPPAKDSAPTPANVAALRVWLSSIQAFAPRSAERPWRFYEEIDAYLGPWGEHGYPIGYGKKYCKRFFNDATLRGDPASRAWMEQTLLLLQREIACFVLERYCEQTLPSLSERELCRFAFGSHSRAYINAGLARVAIRSPSVIANVAFLLRPDLDSLNAWESNAPLNLHASALQIVAVLRHLVPEVLSQL